MGTLFFSHPSMLQPVLQGDPKHPRLGFVTRLFFCRGGCPLSAQLTQTNFSEEEVPVISFHMIPLTGSLA